MSANIINDEKMNEPVNEPVNETVNEPKNESTSTYKVYNNFDEMKLKDELTRGIYNYGYERPSEIQCRGIGPITEGHDVIGQAQSGMGKTGTYSIGTLQVINHKIKDTQAIILANTRELATQVESVINNLGKYMKISVCLSVSGIPVKNNIEALKSRPHIVVGTPGRVYDMVRRKALRTNMVKILVVDEADEMIKDTEKYGDDENGNAKFGFLDQIKFIFRALPSSMQVALFSATMPPDFFELTTKFMRNPIQILIEPEKLTLNGIKQYCINVDKNEYKYDIICDLFDILSVSQSIIYCNSRKMVEDLSYKLREANFCVSSIHGSMTPVERSEKMKEFITAQSRVLVSTDLLSRGIDVQQISVVINYDIPKSVDNYLHRIGRSGRYGRKGIAINFNTPYDAPKLKAIEKHYGIEIEPFPADTAALSEYF
jgi:translation initiation factor 4A